MAGKALKVEFLVPCSYGFKPDTPGKERGVDGAGLPVTHSEDFEPGQVVTFPANEEDVVRGLISDGICVEA